MEKEPLNTTPLGAASTDKANIDDSFDVQGLLLDYVAHWKWFILCVILATGYAYYYSATIVPTYKVGASLYLNDDNATKTNAIAMNGDHPLINMKDYIDETEIELMKSRNNMMLIVDSLGMSYEYSLKGQLRNTPLYKDNALSATMDRADLDKLEKAVVLHVTRQGRRYNVALQTDDEPVVSTFESLPATVSTPAGQVTLDRNPLDTAIQLRGTQIIRIRNPRTVAGQLSTGLNIEFAKNSMTILQLSLTTPRPEQATDVLNTLVTFYNRQIIEDKNRSALQTEAFIMDRLEMIHNELKDVETRLKDYRQEHNITNIDAQISNNLSRKSTTENELSQLEANARMLEDARAMVQGLAIQDEMLEIGRLGAVTPNDAINQSINSFNDDVARYNTVRRDMTPENELIQNKLRALREKRDQILKNISAAKTQINEQIRSISAIESRSTSQLAAQPTIDKGLQEIFREQSVKDNIYTFLLQKREEIALQKTLATPTAQFIDDPTEDGLVEPHRVIILAVGFLLGLIIPALFLYLKRLLFPKFKDQDELERLTSVPILGEICRKDGKEPVVVGQNVATPIAELFRLLRNNVNFINNAGERKVIVVTSSTSGEGKTFVTINLALTFALTGKRVCVVGLDIRRPALAHDLDLDNHMGVTTYLTGNADSLDQVIQPSDLSENLYVLTSGPVPPNPNELLLSDRMGLMMDELRRRFDYILVDTAPIGLVSDTLLIVPHSDVQIYVTRASYSTKKSLKTLHSAINAGRLSKAYIVLNAVNMRNGAYHYRRYGSYGYAGHGTYGYKYTSRKKKRWFRRRR